MADIWSVLFFFVPSQAKREKYGTKLGQEPKNVLFHS